MRAVIMRMRRQEGGENELLQRHHGGRSKINRTGPIQISYHCPDDARQAVAVAGRKVHGRGELKRRTQRFAKQRFELTGNR
jgi:hypothetical protein